MQQVQVVRQSKTLPSHFTTKSVAGAVMMIETLMLIVIITIIKQTMTSKSGGLSVINEYPPKEDAEEAEDAEDGEGDRRHGMYGYYSMDNNGQISQYKLGTNLRRTRTMIPPSQSRQIVPQWHQSNPILLILLKMMIQQLILLKIKQKS